MFLVYVSVVVVVGLSAQSENAVFMMSPAAVTQKMIKHSQKIRSNQLRELGSGPEKGRFFRFLNKQKNEKAY